MQQGFQEGTEPAAPQEGPQPAMEAEAEMQQGSSKEEGVRVPGAILCAPPSFQGSWRPDGDQEALLPKAWREEVEVWQVL